MPRRRGPDGPDGPDGLAIVDKPAGWTSHDVVAKARIRDFVQAINADRGT